MRRALALILTLLLVMPCAHADGSRSYTILVYMCGGDLESEDYRATSDLREMVKGGLTADGPVTLLVETGGAWEWRMNGVSSEENQRHLVTADGLQTLDLDLGARNMGEAETLADFVRFGMEEYPADRCVLLLWDHGGGPIDGVCFDETFGEDGLDLSEMAAALDVALGGEKLEILGFDACLMANFETAYALKDYCQYFVASEEYAPGRGWDYDAWLKELAANPDMETEELARRLVDTHIEDNRMGLLADAATLSVLHPGGLPAVAEALDALGVRLNRALAEDFDALMEARGEMLALGEALGEESMDLIDAHALCEVLSGIAPEECRALQDAVEKAICYTDATRDIAPYVNGFSVFFPYSTLYMLEDIHGVYSGFTYMPAYAAFVLRFADGVRDVLSDGHAADGATVGYDFGDLWEGLF